MEVGNSRDSTQDVAWGPLVFEARRFVELRKKSLWQQFLSAESFGMGLFYTLNVSRPNQENSLTASSKRLALVSTVLRARLPRLLLILIQTLCWCP